MKKNFFKRYFISGLLVWLPVIATIWVVKTIVHLLDQSLTLLPEQYRPEHWGVHLPGIGILLTLVVLFLTGLLITNFVGDKLVSWWDRLIGHIPLVRTVHASVKQVLRTVFTPEGRAFRKAVLVQWPSQGLWTIGFETGSGFDEVSQRLNQADLVSVFVVATPNPTSGFLMLYRREEVIELDIGIDQALKYVLSLGVMCPGLGKKSEGIKNA